MHFKKKFIKLLEERTGVQWRDLDHKKIYITLVLFLALIVLAIVLIVNALFGKGDQKTVPEQDMVANEEEQSTGEEKTEPEDDALKVDAYEEINDLIGRYFAGLANGDLEQVAEAVDVLSDEEKLTIEKKKDYIESYDQLTCYTKAGLEENSYVVFAAYEMKIYNIDTAAPGIMALYVCTAEDGSLYIFNGEASEELKDYVLQLAADEEVAAVIADVDSRYQQLAAENEDLGKFADTMLQSQEEVVDVEPEAPAEEETAGELETPVKTVTTDNVRIREERSADSAMLDTLAADTGVTVYANYSDGWSKIEYNGIVGYCKTEFLKDTAEAPTVTEETQTDAQTPETDTQDQETDSAEVMAVDQQMQFKETVTIRADRSKDSDRITSGYAMELVQVIESYSDGWSKIEYNGKTGYCKTEFLQEPQ